MEEQLSPAQKAQMANRIADLDQQIAKLDTNLAKVEQQIPITKGRKQQSFQAEATNLRQQRATFLQEANTLRVQLGLPMVIPASNQAPQVTQVIIQQQKRGGCLRNTFIALGVLVLIVIIVALANNGQKSSNPATTNISSTTQNQANVSAEKPSFKVGDDVTTPTVKTRWLLQSFN